MDKLKLLSRLLFVSENSHGHKSSITKWMWNHHLRLLYRKWSGH